MIRRLLESRFATTIFNIKYIMQIYLNITINEIMMNSTKGFTLTELLMSMGIISLLVGISIPALKGARESARNASCQGNLRNGGIAYNIACGELATISKPSQRWGSPQEMLGYFLGSAPPRVMIGGTAYEKKKPYWCASDNRESRG